MNRTSEHITGMAGVAVGISTIVVIPFYFTYSDAPPASNVLARNFINIFLCAFLIVFFTGFSHLIRKADTEYEWAGSLMFGAGMTWVAVLLVGLSLEVGAVFGGPAGTIDPTIDGPLAHGTMLIHGSIGRALTVVILTAAGYGVIRTRLIPVWMGKVAYAIALVNLAFMPAMFFGTDPTQFYSAIGWGNSALVASFIGYWIFAAGVMLLKRR